MLVDTEVPNEPLFATSEVTVAASKFEWTEGKWLLRRIEEVSTGEKNVKECKITADSSGIKFTEIKRTIKDGVIPDDAPEGQIEMMEAAGAEINGSKYSMSYVAGAAELEDENEAIVKDFERYKKDSSIKTNADKTKYYWECVLYNKDGTIRLYSGTYITISALKGINIQKVEIQWKKGKNSPILTVTTGIAPEGSDPEVVEATDNAYTVADNTITFANTQTTSSQLWISEFVVYYTVA